MQLGIDSFVERVVTPGDEAASNSAERVQQLLEEVELADRVGLDVFAIGEHHREEYVASSVPVLLAAMAARTRNIRLSSAVTVLSSDDPIRVFQAFATVDLISGGRAEIIVGRGSFTESYPLFGFDLRGYDRLFAEKLDLLLHLRDEVRVHWEGETRAPLTGQGVWPRPVQKPLPIRLGVGGTPNSFARAGLLGLPLTVAIIGGEPHRFKPLVDLYRNTYRKAGHAGEPDVAVHTLGHVAESDAQAAEEFWPSYSHTFTRIGRERGWGTLTREAFDAQREPTGAFLLGSPETIATKVLYLDTVLGGVSRVDINMSGGRMPHEQTLRAIDLMGTEVKPRLAEKQAGAS
jgi:probable LLM family oxidoreductase